MRDPLAELDDEQRAAAKAVTGPVCIIAGAGTGKTRTVTHRLAYGVSTGEVDPRTALAVTHSRKAAAELGERLEHLGVRGVEARTFHAAALRIAKVYWSRTGRREPAPSVLPERDAWRAWRDSIRSVTGSEPDNTAVRDVIDEVSWARSRLVPLHGYSAVASLAGRHPEVEPDDVAECWKRFTATKERLGKVDFDDLLEIASGLLEGQVDVAQNVRAKWMHVTVDEYQDTDPAQQRLLEAILGPSEEVCVVGDPRQAIYSWKGADPSFLIGFAGRFPKARVFDLTHNYRSSSQILGWANRLAFDRRTRPLTATRPAGRLPKVTRLDHEGGEAAWVAGAAKRAIESGTPPSEIAVLYRFNATQARFEAAFARAGVATVIAEDSTFFDREEVRAVLVPFGRAARSQPDEDGLELLQLILARAGFDREKPPSGLGAARARWESHLALLELLESSAVDSAGELLAEVNSLAVRTHGPRTAGVTLATLHRAKGLEWDVVFLVGMTDGAMPSFHATTDAELAEEERLLHVGVTRARNELHLTWAGANGRGWDNQPSRFLDRFVVTVAPSKGKSRRKPATPAKVTAEPLPSASCPHCAGALKGLAARRLGVCANCVRSAPGEVGRRARALDDVVKEAASEAGRRPDQLLSDIAMLRLLDRRPTTGAEVSVTTGVALKGRWADAAAKALSV